jgi:hypothetical protein
MNVELFKKEFLPRFVSSGEEKFYKSLLLISLNKLVMIEKGTYKGILPNIELLEYYEQLIILYRREGDDIYLKIAKTFRKAAHKIYRVMLKKKMSPINPKFLNVV